MIDERQVPLVLARKYDSAPTDRYNCCYINFAEASYRMTRHLLEMGHRRIGLMFENVSQQFMNSFLPGVGAGTEGGSRAERGFSAAERPKQHGGRLCQDDGAAGRGRDAGGGLLRQ